MTPGQPHHSADVLDDRHQLRPRLAPTPSCSGAVDAKYTITYVLGSVTVSQGGGPLLPPSPTASTITITSTAPASAVVGGATYTPTATATSDDTVVITSATTSICTISSGVVSFLAAGTCTLNFNDKGNSNYVAATQKTQTFSVGSKSTSTTNTITFTSSAPEGKIYSGSNNQTYTVKALATSGLTVTLTIDNKLDLGLHDFGHEGLLWR